MTEYFHINEDDTVSVSVVMRHTTDYHLPRVEQNTSDAVSAGTTQEFGVDAYLVATW